MAEPIRIGTRDSALALWQAEAVQQALEALGHRTELVPVKSEGDLKLYKPLLRFRDYRGIYQGVGHRATRRQNRYCGAFDEGCADPTC